MLSALVAAALAVAGFLTWTALRGLAALTEPVPFSGSDSAARALERMRAHLDTMLEEARRSVVLVWRDRSDEAAAERQLEGWVAAAVDGNLARRSTRRWKW